MENLHIHLPGFTYYELHNPAALAELTSLFYAEVEKKNPTLHAQFFSYKTSKGNGFSELQISTLLVEMAPYLSAFIATLFGVESEWKALQIIADKERILFHCKKEFFTRRVLKKFPQADAEQLNLAALTEQVAAIKKIFTGLPEHDEELALSAMITELLPHDKFIKEGLPPESLAYVRALKKKLPQETTLAYFHSLSDSDESITTLLEEIVAVFERYLAASYFQKDAATKEWVMFRQPHKLDYARLVAYEELHTPVTEFFGHEEHYRRRDGFDLTDERYSRREVTSEVEYCIFCHDRSKDSCSKGLKEKNEFKKNPIGYELKGCPLDQKISESHALQNAGDSIGALALITIDNPMCPGTGHRICNDCMKACIYQKQDPVNIPQIETRVLTDVLNLPWGFEIYSLLTRWNPLNIERPHTLAYNGKKILVVGMGPAGYTMAHYLLNEGFGVVGIDGLKIEPLPVEIAGDAHTLFQPIKNFSSINKKLSERILLGFGGVSEYGITVRWDKNFLTVLYLNLIRRNTFRVYDGIRFGGTLTVDDAWEKGFDHICFAMGAGKPTFVSMKNNLLRGIRKASDFLMALQLTGAGKKDSLANLQIQLPAIVIGGGLTAVDTATELMAYYPVQVEKVQYRYESLCRENGKEITDASFTDEEKKILAVFLQHATEIAEERKRAANKNEAPNFIPLIRKWGGVHLYYRKSLNDAPAYRLNHEEIIKALEEGIFIAEKMSPVEAVADEYGAVQEIIFEKMDVVNGKWKSSNEQVSVFAKSVLVAAGTSPNVMYEREHPATIQLDEWGEFFKSFQVVQNGKTELFETSKGETGFFTSYEKNGKYISFYGDNHPVYEGNVVKAMASAKHGYKKVVEMFKKQSALSTQHTAVIEEWNNFSATLDNEFRPRVVAVNRLTRTIVEVVVYAPQAAKKFQPGQFFRLQNYEVDSPTFENTLLMMEGLALTGAWVDVEKGLLGMIVLEMGASSRMVSMLKPGQRVVVMGPTGAPTEIPEHTTVLLLGGGLGNAVLFSIAKAMKEKNTRVIYFAGYKKKEDIFKRDEVETGTDVVVYSVDSGEPIIPQRPQDKTFVGNIVQAMIAYSTGELGEINIPLHEATRIIAIGSDRMMAAVTAARHTVLKPYVSETHLGIASINSPMQCMMKAVCAQCLQRHVDKETGKEEFVFTCVNQDQCMDDVDFEHLSSRLKVNTLMEKIANKWFEHICERHQLAKG